MNKVTKLFLIITTLLSSSFLIATLPPVCIVGQNSEGIATLWGVTPAKPSTVTPSVLPSSGNNASAGYAVTIDSSGSSIYTTGINGDQNAALWITRPLLKRKPWN